MCKLSPIHCCIKYECSSCVDLQFTFDTILFTYDFITEKKGHYVSVALLLNFWREISTWLCGLTNSHLHKDNLVNISLLTAVLWYTRKIFEESWQESWRIANTWRCGLLTEVPLPCLHCSNRLKDLRWLHFWKMLKTVEIGSIFTI